MRYFRFLLIITVIWLAGCGADDAKVPSDVDGTPYEVQSTAQPTAAPTVMPSPAPSPATTATPEPAPAPLTARERAELEAIRFMVYFVDHMFEEMYEMAVEAFREVNFTTLHAMYGSVNDITLLDWQFAQGHDVFDFVVEHTTATVDYRVAVGRDRLISGFFSMSSTFRPMEICETAVYAAEAVMVGAGTAWELDGMLTVPKWASAENPVPAVVLVQGSGAGNMDQSAFDNRPFYDIADYLSSHGIAVLRYHKRTYTHGAAMAQIFGSGLTVWEESIEDALLAAKMLQNDPRVSRVYVAGLSLGAMLAPRIAEEGGLDGAIMLAGSPRALHEIGRDQGVQATNDMLAEGIITQEIADEWMEYYEGLLEEGARLTEMTGEELLNTVIIGMPAIYHLSIIESLPLRYIQRNQTPVLIIHGDRDFQVFTEPDFRMLEGATRELDYVTAILYDNVNHLLMQSRTGYNDMREYMVAGRVDEGVLRDIVSWVNLR